MFFFNLMLGALLFGQLLWTLTRLVPRRLALGVSLAIYALGSLPVHPSPILRCLLPNFHIFQTNPVDGRVLLVNALYCSVWMAYLSFCSWVFKRT